MAGAILLIPENKAYPSPLAKIQENKLEREIINKAYNFYRLCWKLLKNNIYICPTNYWHDIRAI